MKHPEKWRETINPYELPFHNFTLTEVIGYPHAGNDVFQVNGLYQGKYVEAYIKVPRQRGANIANEVSTIAALKHPLSPTIIDCSFEQPQFLVSLAKDGERLSTILGENKTMASLDYLYEYGATLAKIHATEGDFPPVQDRSYFHMPKDDYFTDKLSFVRDYLIRFQPSVTHHCFCHGDFHYANILWTGKHISAILDYELSGIGNKEFDIAWALILRPGQKFLKTDEEINLFLSGYHSSGSYDWKSVEYYMVLIYVYFYHSNPEMPDYREHIVDFFTRHCRQ